MPIVKADIEATLSRVDAKTLRVVLEAAEVHPRGAQTPRELAARIADALWWHSSTPLGYLADRITLEKIVAHVGRKLGVGDRLDAEADGWAQLNQLTRAMFQVLPDDGVSLLDLDDATRARIQPSWIPSVGWGMGSGTSAGTAWMSGKALGWLRGPLGRLIPLIPPLAPYYHMLVKGLGVTRMVAWPLALGLAVLSANSALGANERKLVPLLLGVGALGPKPVEDAQIIDFPDVIPADPPDAGDPGIHPSAAAEPSDIASGPELAELPEDAGSETHGDEAAPEASRQGSVEQDVVEQDVVEQDVVEQDAIAEEAPPEESPDPDPQVSAVDPPTVDTPADDPREAVPAETEEPEGSVEDDGDAPESDASGDAHPDGAPDPEADPEDREED